MKIFLIPIIVLITISAIHPQIKKYNITFIVTASNVQVDSSVYIVGNNSELGNWDPSAVPLSKVNDSTFEKTFSFKAGTEIEYKFTRGSWGKEALTAEGKVPSNSRLKIEQDTVIHISITKWKDEIPGENETTFKGQITGTVKYFFNMKGKDIKPRDIIVWLPPSYKINVHKRYPVLYMQDGQNLFDPKTSSFGIDWQLDESADSLIKAKAIKEIIIVGIYNTVDRSTEYIDSKIGHSYMNFVATKLKPFIDKNFRTKPDRDNSAVGGSSAGGLISFMLLWEYPEIFSKAACLSPAFHIENINYIPNVLNYKGQRKNIRVYFDIGTEGLDARLKPGVDEMVKALESKGYKTGKDIEYFIAQGASHNEAAWAKRNWRYLEFMFGKKIKKTKF